MDEMILKCNQVFINKYEKVKEKNQIFNLI